MRKAVAQAWSAVLGPAAIAKNLTWEDAGGDLISVLRLWFNLEEALGVQLPLDVVGPDAKLDDVVVAVEQALGLRARRLGHDLASQPPMVFFCRLRKATCRSWRNSARLLPARSVSS